MALSPEVMAIALKELRNRNRGYMNPDHYSKFMPAELNNRKPANLTESFNNIAPIGERGNLATQLVITQEQNKRDKEAAERAKAQAQRMRKLYGRLRSNQPERVRNRAGVLDLSDMNIEIIRGPGGGVKAKGKKWGKDRIPEVSDIRRLNPHAPMKTINLPGLPNPVHVNSQVAPIFRSFLIDLLNTGYKIHSIGGHADRNIAGTNTPSLHSYGFAIDINPAQNPVTYGKIITDLPKGIGQLAARYGLAWGGAWNGSKKDTMHFSVPYGGTK